MVWLLRLIHCGTNIDWAQGCRVCPEEMRTNGVEETKFDPYHTLLCRYYYYPVLQTKKII